MIRNKNIFLVCTAGDAQWSVTGAAFAHFKLTSWRTRETMLIHSFSWKVIKSAWHHVIVLTNLILVYYGILMINESAHLT